MLLYNGESPFSRVEELERRVLRASNQGAKGFPMHDYFIPSTDLYSLFLADLFPAGGRSREWIRAGVKRYPMLSEM